MTGMPFDEDDEAADVARYWLAPAGQRASVTIPPQVLLPPGTVVEIRRRGRHVGRYLVTRATPGADSEEYELLPDPDNDTSD